MDNDDRQIGRVLSRREVLALLGSAGAAMLVGCSPNRSDSAPPTSAAAQVPTPAPTPRMAALPACIVRPEQTEGPYFVDERLNRADIRPDPSDGSLREGAPLRLVFRVAQLNGNSCAPLAGAFVDVWHCDTQGVYSDVENAAGKKFLRGYQQTNENGAAEFLTIYPGWYPGRAVHIHFMIRTSLDSGQEFTSQLYFDEAVTDQVYARPPYAARGERTTRNQNDGIFRDGGDQLLLQTSEDDQGYIATFDIGLQML